MLLFCSCSQDYHLSREDRTRLDDGLTGSDGESVVRLELCRAAALRDPRLSDIASAEDLSIVACHPRAVRWLFRAAGAELDMRKVRFFNYHEQPVSAILEALGKGSFVDTNTIAYSGPNLPLIPEYGCHPFRSKVATCSGPNLPLLACSPE